MKFLIQKYYLIFLPFILLPVTFNTQAGDPIFKVSVHGYSTKTYSVSATERESSDVDSGTNSEEEEEKEEAAAAAAATRRPQKKMTLTPVYVSDAKEDEEDEEDEDDDVFGPSQIQPVSLTLIEADIDDNGILSTCLECDTGSFTAINILHMLGSTTAATLNSGQFQHQLAWLQGVPAFTFTMQTVIPLFLVTNVISQEQSGFEIQGVLNTETETPDQEISQVTIQVDAQGQCISFSGSTALGTIFSVQQQPTAAPEQTDVTGDAETGDTEIPEEAGGSETEAVKNKQGKEDSIKNQPGKKESGKKESGKKESGKKESGKKESGKKESGKKESGKKESGKKESGKKESGKKESGNDEQKAAAVNSDITGNEEIGEGEDALSEPVEKIGTEEGADQLPPPEGFDSNEPGGNQAGDNVNMHAEGYSSDIGITNGLEGPYNVTQGDQATGIAGAAIGVVLGAGRNSQQ